jgi:hypothetical protein
MRYTTFAIGCSFFFAVLALPSIVERDLDDVNGAFQPRICPNLHVKGGGCIRCTVHNSAVAIRGTKYQMSAVSI